MIWAEIKDDKSIPVFLESLEIDGWYHLYVVYEGDGKGEDPKTTTKNKAKIKMENDEVADAMKSNDDVCRLGNKMDMDEGDVVNKVGMMWKVQVHM